MTATIVKPTGTERRFADEEIIVSKTDTTGRLVYVNNTFCKIGLYSESELIGRQHSIVRHPDMPRAVFKLLWDTIQQGEEIFAYVKNMAKNGDHYWVLAHVTPSFDRNGRIIGFHSNRRVPDRSALAVVEPLYRDLLAVESRGANSKEGLAASERALRGMLEARNTAYDRFIFSTLEAA